MTIDEAISHAEEVAEQNDTQADKIGRQLIGSAIDKYATDCRECAAEHRQLAEWLVELKELREEYAYINKVSYSYYKELKEAKRLLKMAVYDIQYLCNNYAVEANKEIKDLLKLHYRCDICKYDANCKRKGKETECCYDWRHYSEALKLIGETNDEP